MSGCEEDNIDDELGVIKVSENEYGKIIVEQRGKKVIAEGMDFAASIIMASGAQLHIENQGVLNRHIIEMLTGIEDQRYYSFMLYNNAYQLLAQLINLSNTKYFKDPVINGALEDLSNDFDFIKEYYKTYILPDSIIQKDRAEKLDKFESYCREF